ncbi:MAG: patatin-like phospholipase family protein [Thermodesulfobacteriota bacterium]|jgi:patatin-like phospholipase/acyl hydrolase
MAVYRILSIDGGGIRGIISTILLQRLSAEPSLSGWLEKVDLLAGTSTGGLLALGIAKPLNLQVIRDLYETKGKIIFDDSWLRDLRDLWGIIGAKYDIANLGKELQAILGATTLSQLSKRVLITAFDLDGIDSQGQRTWKPKLFHNFPGVDSDGDQLAYKVGVYTAAAPTYFPSADGYIDGGVFASNPAMCALAQTQDPRIGERPELTDVVLLSLGTGTSLTYITGECRDWGYAQWIKPLVNLMLDGVAGIADYQCSQLLGSAYWRLAPVFPPPTTIPMDGVDRVPEMIAFAEQQVALGPTIEWLKTYW